MWRIGAAKTAQQPPLPQQQQHQHQQQQQAKYLETSEEPPPITHDYDSSSTTPTTPEPSPQATAGDKKGFVQDLLQSNPYFSAGFGLIGVGAGLSILRGVSQHAINAGKRQLMTTMEIPSRDKSYTWFLEWMAAHPQGNHKRHLSLSTSFQQFENGEIKTQTSFVPGAGAHIIRYGGRFIHVHREREKSMTVDFSTGAPWETVTLTTFGKDGRPVFSELLREAREQALQAQESHTVVFTTGQGGGTEWRRFGFPRRRKPLDSVVLAPGQRERIVGDVREFLEAANWYADRGIPHRRGYLLYGPPGTGKSSFITALAGELRLNICVLNLHSRGVTDDTLSHLLNNAPQRSIILLEDIDATLGAEARDHTPQSPYSAGSSTLPSHTGTGLHPVSPSSMGSGGGGTQHRLTGVTFSGLLNALDGVVATEGGGRIVFMTTNHPERLPAALVRPGRIDVKEEFGLATAPQAKALFLRFFREEGGSRAGEFAAAVPEGCVPMAALQGLLLAYKHDADAAIAAAAACAVVENRESRLESRLQSFAAHRKSAGDSSDTVEGTSTI